MQRLHAPFLPIQLMTTERVAEKPGTERLRRYSVRIALATSASFIAGLAPLPSAAQVALPAPPTRQAIDQNGVNLLTGSFSEPAPAISVGPAGGGLAYRRTMTDIGVWTDNFSGIVLQLCVIPTTPSGYDCADNTPFYNVSLGDGPPYVFRQDIGVEYVSVSGADAKLTKSGDVWTLTTPDGTVATFGPDIATSPYTGPSPEGFDQDNVGSVSSIQRPDGERLTFHYRAAGLGERKLASVFSNRGYQVYFEYEGASAWMSRAVALNNAHEYCDPLATTCVVSGAWPYLTFAEGSNESAVTDALGRTTRFFRSKSPSNRPVYRLTGVRRPDLASGLSVSLTYKGGPSSRPYAYGPVATVDQGLGVWTYSISGYPYSLVKGSDGSELKYVVVRGAGSGANSLISTSQDFGVVIDANGNETKYTYENISNLGNLLKSVTLPEGGQVFLSHDARGNVTQHRQVSKTPGAPGDIVWSATYSAICANPVTCNRPLTMTDARGGVTDYTYDAAGNLLTETGPAPAPGAPRPQTRYVWEQRYAWFKQNGSSAITQAATPVWVQVSQSQCMTGATC